MDSLSSELIRGVATVILGSASITCFWLATAIMLNKSAYNRNRRISLLIKKNNNETITEDERTILQNYADEGLVVFAPFVDLRENRWVSRASLSSRAIQDVSQFRKSPG